MNILFLSFIPVIPHFGGIQRVTDLLSSEFASRGYNVHYLYYEYRTLPVGYVPKFPQYYLKTDHRNEDDYLREWKNYLCVNNIDLILNQNSDIVSCQLLSVVPEKIKKITVNHLQPYSGFEYQRIIQLHSMPSSIKGHIYRLIGILFPTLINRIELSSQSNRIKRAIAVSDKYCVLSQKYIDRIAKYDSSIDISNCIAISNPIVNDGRFTQENKQNIVLYVGRLVNNPKNLLSLLRTWKYIQKQKDWTLLIVGDGPDRQTLENYCFKHKLKNVRFEGNQSDVSRYYKVASFVCVVSFHESWAMSLVEGMSYGAIPVAFNSYEAAATIIDDNISGLLITPFKYKEMANRIIHIINNPNEKFRMMENAYVKANQFSVNRIVDQWEKILKDEN